MLRRFAPLGGALLLLALPYLPGTPSFWATLCNMIGLASLVAMGLIVLTGVGGMTSFGQAAFVGIGAYATAVATTTFGLSPWIGLPIALIATTGIALVIGLVTVSLSGHYLPIGTIAWGLAIFFLFGNVQWLGGFNGISGVPPLSFFGKPLYGAGEVYPVVWLLVFLAVIATKNLLNSRVGRAMRALRNGSVAAEAFGISVARTKLIVFVYAGLLAGLSGWAYAHIQRSVAPTAFGLNASIEYLLMAVVGGAGHIYGAILGAAFVVVVKDQLQNILPMFVSSSSSIELVLLGFILVMVLQFADSGLWSYVARLFPRRAHGFPAHSTPFPEHRKPRNVSPLLDVCKLTKKFGGLTAVDSVSFEVKPGEILSLLGPNGAGKSTTFNLISGATRLTDGEVRFKGARIDGLGADTIARRGLARTFQHVKLVPNMTVSDNVAIGAHARGRTGVVGALLRLNRTEETHIYSEVALNLKRTGLMEQASDLAGNLSLGSARIVEIARALCASPDLLLLDEPAAGLRHSEKQRLAQLLRTLRDEGMSILLVEHDMQFVMELSDRIVVLDFGAMIAEGTPGDIQKNEAVQEAYLGSVA